MELSPVLEALIKQGGFALVSAMLVYILHDMRKREVEATKQWIDRYAEMRKQLDDRYAEDRKRSEEQLTKLGLEFRATVSANTEALTKLSTIIDNHVCPFGSADQDTLGQIRRGSPR